MFDDIERKGFEKQLEELRDAIARLVEIVKPLAEDAYLRMREREAQEARDRARYQVQLQYNAMAEAQSVSPRCDCSPTRERFLSRLWGAQHD